MNLWYLTCLLSSLHLFTTSYHQSLAIRPIAALASAYTQHSIRSTSTSLRCAQMEHNVNTPSPHTPPLEFLDREEVTDGHLICTEKLSSDDVERLVRERDFHRSRRDYSKADEIKLFLEQQYSVEITDVSYKQGGRSTWRYKLDRVGAIETNFMELAHMSYELTSGSNSSEASIHIASVAKDLLRLQYYSFVDDLTDNIAFRAINKSPGDTDSITTNSSSSMTKGRSTSTEMQGRKYADAAFEFSMSGITDPELFAMLADSACSELMRFGSRPSCKPVNILHIVEKLAVAGVKDHPIFGLAYDILLARGVTHDVTRQLKPSNRYSLFSSRPLMWLWRYATKQKKPTNTSYTTPYGSIRHNSSMSAYKEISSELSSGINPIAEGLTTKIEYPLFSAIFTNCTLPLIIDLGCGYGVSLLSMCDRHAQQVTASARELNFLGIDLSGRAIRYANGISNRWGFNGKCAFQYGDCLTGLEWVRNHYAGPVVLVVINFPTPYHIRNIISCNHADDSSNDVTDNGDDNAHSAIQGNAQLFDSLESFMCNAALFSSIARMFNKLSLSDPNIEPCVFLQSNVEDVAVTMRNAVLSVDELCVGTGTARFDLPEDMNHARGLMSNLFHAPIEEEEEKEEDALEYTHQQQWVTLDQLSAATNSTAGGGRLSQRLQLWMDYLDRWSGDSACLTSPSAALASPYSRACGVGWLPESLLPYGARTETEAHCEFECKPVHRMLFVYRSYYQL